eukprot:TRINITY_DN1874_c0_g3_i1.p1 TRINITY_DN1874_c0_g3~~TRINITY_DN1874_c0_g3_i1.p1  ORF type:complete len:424 (+),score=59.79 TRINITY_DN1874_c0_g3_i1:115-1386(+)
MVLPVPSSPPISMLSGGACLPASLNVKLIGPCTRAFPLLYSPSACTNAISTLALHSRYQHSQKARRLLRTGPEKVLGSPISRIWRKSALQKWQGVKGQTSSLPVTALASSDVPDTMKGWSYDEHGPPSVLKFGELPVPAIKENQVLVKVAAAALNPVDFKRRYGNFKASDSPFPTTPGYDVAGVVVKAGSQVASLKVGDEVYGDVSEEAIAAPKQFGSLAQYVAVEENLVSLKPANLSFLEAASLPLALLTAYQGFEKVDFKEGETVFIVAGAGGVGTLALQLAKKVFKASLVATSASAQKADFVKSLGADVVVDYKTQDYTELPERYDFVFDMAGEGAKSVNILKEGGRHAAITGPTPPPSFRYVLKPSAAGLEKLRPFLESGEIHPVLDPKGTFPFSQLKEAFEYLETGRATGKIVIGPIS